MDLQRLRKQGKYFLWCLIMAIITSCISGRLFETSRRANRHWKQEQSSPDEEKKEEGLSLSDVEENPLMRVLLKGDGYQSIAHPQVALKSPKGLRLSHRLGQEQIGGEKELVLRPDDERFQGESIRVSPLEQAGQTILTSVQRGEGSPGYRGVFELYATAEGIVIVNELPMEDYLKAVVPSEMPINFHGEALKAQAVCARSYAYCQRKTMGYPEYRAHVDDSTTYQVYGNAGEKEATSFAVEETKGQVLVYENCVAKAYYFSTSCGHTTDIQAWGGIPSKENQYLQGVSVSDEQGDYEKKLPWYRWHAVIPKERFKQMLELYSKTVLGELRQVEISKRGVGDIALELVATGEKGQVRVTTEYQIRKALAGEYPLIRQDQQTVTNVKLLPSAFITIRQEADRYIIEGGGSGHGIGMSQNGANCMALKGFDYQRILKFFYTEATLAVGNRKLILA